MNKYENTYKTLEMRKIRNTHKTMEMKQAHTKHWKKRKQIQNN